MSAIRKGKKKVKVSARSKKAVKPAKRAKKKSGLSAAFLKKIEKKLKTQLNLFNKTLARHERKTTALLPADAPEAVSLKQEIAVTEKIEKQESQTIHLIQGAIRRLRAGAFGQCVACRKFIPEKRLLVQPWSVYCVPCKEAKEARQ